MDASAAEQARANRELGQLLDEKEQLIVQCEGDKKQAREIDQAHINDLTVELDALRRDSQSRQETINSLIADNRQQKDREAGLRDLAESHARTVASLQDQLQQSHGMVRQQEVNLAALESTIATLHKSLEDSRIARDEGDSSLRTLLKEQDDVFQHEKALFEAETQRLRAHIAEQERIVKDLQSQLAAANTSLSQEFKARAAAVAAARDEAQAALNQSKSLTALHTAHLQDSLRDKETQLRELEASLAAARNDHESNTRSVNARSIELMTDLQQLQAQVANLRADLESVGF